MSMWISNQSVGVALGLMAVGRVVQLRLRSLAHPATLRRAQSGMLRVITVVAGH
jgi:hypothetical protein